MALSAANRVPIADLNPGISVSSSVIHGIITLVWPYSSVNHTFSFLLVEPDFRLRRQRGQVRISLRDSCARRVTRAGLVSGDEIYLAIDGAQWQKDNASTSTPGRGIEWELLYTDHLRFEKASEDGRYKVVDTSRMSLSPDLPPSSTVSSVPPLTVALPIQAQVTPRKSTQADEADKTWSSPIFVKEKRIPDIFPLKSDFNAFHEEEEEWPTGPPSKKLRFGRKSDQWRFVRRSASPQAISERSYASESSEVPHIVNPASPATVKIALEVQISDTEEDLVPSHDPQNESSRKEEDQGFASEQYNSKDETNPIDSDTMAQSSLVNQMPDASSFQSMGQESLATGTVESSSDSHPVPETFSQIPVETVSSSITLISEQEEDLNDATQDVLSVTQGHSLDLPQSALLEANLSPVISRILSESPEPQLEINIQNSTPLIQPISIEPPPFTPRLQPLPSPGLDLVSPIDQRHPTQFGGYFARRGDTETKVALSSQIVDNDPLEKQAVQIIDVNVTETRESRDLNVKGQPAQNPQTNEDTFFNQLLARYDEGTDQTSEAIDRPVSSPMQQNSSKENDVADIQVMPMPSMSETTSPINESLEVIETNGTSDDQQDLESNTIMEEDVENAEESEFRESIEESEDISDEDDTIPGKWRDATYKPSQDLSTGLDVGIHSPLLTQHSENLQSSDHSQEQEQEQEEHLEINTDVFERDILSEGNKSIPDTYLAEDSHKDQIPSVGAEDENNVEVIDLLDSDSSSSISGVPEDQLAPKSRNDEHNVVAETTMDDRASSTPQNEISNSDHIIELAKTPSEQDSHNDQHIETQHQKFYTAPVDFDDLEEESMADSTQTPTEAVDEHNIDLVDHQSPTPTILETPQKLNNQSSEISQASERNTRSSQRATRSQSQHILKAVAPEDEILPEGLEALQTAEPSHVDSTDTTTQGFRTANDYYSALATLSEFHNNLTSLLAVVVASSKPVRSTTGPRDFTQSVYLAAPNSQYNNDFTIAQFYRPYASALPYPLTTGSVILLKNFKVQSYKRKMSLLSSSTSAWAVFDQASAANQSEMKVTIAGPPVDFGGAERGIAWGLGKWWTSLDQDTQSKIRTAANTANDQATAEFEKKAASARKLRETKSQSQPHLRTPTRRQTRSSQSQSQSQDQTISIPNTPSTHAVTPSPVSRRTRNSQSIVTTPTKAQHNLRSGLAYSDNEASQSIEPDEGKVSSEAEPTASQTPKSSARTASAIDHVSSQGNVKTRAQSRRDAAENTGKKTGGKKALWHELRDGAIYKD